MDLRQLPGSSGIPLRNDASGWTVGELNAILENNHVGTKGNLRASGAFQWEFELFNGRPNAQTSFPREGPLVSCILNQILYHILR